MEVKQWNLTSNIQEYRKKYYEERKDTYYKEKHVCSICGGKYVITNKRHHYDSKKHQYAIIKKELEDLKKKINEKN